MQTIICQTDGNIKLKLEDLAHNCNAYFTFNLIDRSFEEEFCLKISIKLVFFIILFYGWLFQLEKKLKEVNKV
jgi:hypothetical protein